MKDLMLQGYGIYGHVEPFALKQRPHVQPPALKCGECKGNRLQQWTDNLGWWRNIVNQQTHICVLLTTTLRGTWSSSRHSIVRLDGGSWSGAQRWPNSVLVLWVKVMLIFYKGWHSYRKLAGPGHSWQTRSFAFDDARALNVAMNQVLSMAEECSQPCTTKWLLDPWPVVTRTEGSEGLLRGKDPSDPHSNSGVLASSQRPAQRIAQLWNRSFVKQNWPRQ